MKWSLTNKIGALTCLLVSWSILSSGCGSDSSQSAAPAPRSDTLVQTSFGPVEGTHEGSLIVFRGIPYAKPPKGQLRFRPPQPPDPWRATLKADHFGPAAPQPFDPIETASSYTQDEDCLSLNVWTPGTDSARRPVMVFIHGGGWTNGGSVDPWYDGAAFARRGDVVLVTINYRLGVLGFLYLAEVGGAEFATSGNLGLLDQIAALEWVRDNIAAFGGDPHNVTVFGESAGSMSVSTLLGMPAARGLFHRAITESGAVNTARSREYAARVTDRFMAIAGVDDLEGLQGLTTDQLMEAEEAYMYEVLLTDLLFGPVIDGVSLPEPALHAIASGNGADVALLTGTNRDETRYWYFYIPGILDLPPELWVNALDYFANAVDATGLAPEALIANYESRRQGATPGDISMALGTDLFFRLPHIRLAEAQYINQQDTWMYLFDWSTPLLDGRLGAPHAVELPFVFNNLGASGVSDLLGEDPPQALADLVQDIWITFARTGDPNHTGLPQWPTYETGHRATMLLDLNPSVHDDPFSADRQVWDGIPFDSVTPATSRDSGSTIWEAASTAQTSLYGPETVTGSRLLNSLAMLLLPLGTVFLIQCVRRKMRKTG